MEIFDKSAGMGTSAVFNTRQHVNSTMVFWNRNFSRHELQGHVFTGIRAEEKPAGRFEFNEYTDPLAALIERYLHVLFYLLNKQL